jgi:hypothetical protein
MSAFHDDGSASGMTHEEHAVAMRHATHLIKSLQDLEEGLLTNGDNKGKKRKDMPTINASQVQLVYNYLIRGGQLGLAILAARKLGVTANGVIDATLYFVASIADTGAILMNAAARQVGNAALMCIDVAVTATSAAAQAAAHTVSTLAQYFTFENLETGLNVAVGTCQGLAANAAYSRLCRYSNDRNVMFEDIADTINRLTAGINEGVTALEQFQGENLLLYTPSDDVNHQPEAFLRLADTCAAGTPITDNLRRFEEMIHRENAHVLRTNARSMRTDRPGTHHRASYHMRPNVEKLLQQRKSLIVTNVLTGMSLNRIRANTEQLQDEINEAIHKDRLTRTLTEMKSKKAIETASLPVGGRRTKGRKAYRKSYKKRTHKRRPRRKTHKLLKRKRRRTRK